MKKIINIYAPVDGYVDLISKIPDSVFSEKMLGDGVFITPKSTDKIEFYSPMTDCVVESIVDTKHAYFFGTTNKDDPKLLMHIGLDTVKLGGRPFELKVKENQKVNLKDKLVVVDTEEIQKNNISLATPIIVILDEFPGWTIENIKTGEVKRGDEIFSLVINIETKINSVNSKLKNKYADVAQAIYQYVGTNANYTTFYNCMTRLRFAIEDKAIVDIENIKKIDAVKGINWSGTELQIIIGGEVLKIKDQLDIITGLLTNDNKILKTKKESLGKKILGSIGAIFGPVIPAIMAVGLLASLQAILVQSGVIVDPPKGDATKVDVWSALLFILSKVGLEILGILFLFSTVRYLNGNVIIAILVGITMSSRRLMGPGLGAEAGFLEHDGVGWILFKIQDISFYLKHYEGTVLPYIFTGILLVLFENWIKKWMPSIVDIVLRPFLLYTVIAVGAFFIFGPIFGLIEQFLNLIISYIGMIPFGVGTGVLAFLWQPLVLTGVHAAIGMALSNSIIIDETPSILYPAIVLGIFGQLGAAIGVLIKTKDSRMRSIIIPSMIPTLFGISEPLIYSVNLPKWKPFWLGACAAGIAGVVSGALGLTTNIVGGRGILALTTFTDGIWEIIFVAMTMLISIGSGICLVMLFYRERPNEYKTFNKLKKTITRTIKFNSKDLIISVKDLKLQVNNVLIENEETIKNNMMLFRDFENEIVNYNNIKTKIENLQMKNDLFNDKLSKLKDKFYKKNNFDKYQAILQYKEENSKIFQKLKHAESELENKHDSYNKVVNNVEKIQDELCEDFSVKINEMSLEYKIETLNYLNYDYFNMIHSTDILYGLTEVHQSEFNKKIQYNTKNKFKLLFLRG